LLSKPISLNEPLHESSSFRFKVNYFGGIVAFYTVIEVPIQVNTKGLYR
jgi:hypothetical protein